jgi:hypothetical protein
MMLSASNIPPPDDSQDGTTSVILMPAFITVSNVTPSTVPSLIDDIINETTTNVTPLDETKPLSINPELPFKVSRTPYDYLILLCSHKTRDARCGQSAPLLKRELERHLRPLGLHRDLHDDRPGGVGVFFINHVGGHKFSANVIIYRRIGTPGTKALSVGGPNGATNVESTGEPKVPAANGEAELTTEKPSEAVQGIWLARVRPEDCENLIRYTILQGKVVKPDTQLRGGFDRCTQLTSW